MSKLASVLLALVLIVLLGSGLRWSYLHWQQLRGDAPVAGQSAMQLLWSATLHDSNGKSHALSQYRDRPLIVNFWATWCEPCRDEMPEISALANQYPQVAVLGLAIDEAPAVHEFSQTTPVSYPLLIAENEGMPLAEALGNTKGVLPYTVIISPQGQVTHTFFGRVNREMLLKALALD